MNTSKPTDTDAADAEEEKKEKKIKLNNDIRDIRTIRQLGRVNLDYDSPRLRQAMDDLGVSMDAVTKQEKSNFEKKGVDPDVIELRYKHFQARLIDTINRVIEQRREIIVEE